MKTIGIQGNNYYYQVWDTNPMSGKRTEMIAEGYTASIPKLTERPRKEQESFIKTKYGWSKGYYFKEAGKVDTPQAKYDKTHTTGLYLKLNKETDKDIIEKLDASGNKQGYIKQLIRADIKSNK